VALARALASEPDILLLDEPFGALDLPIRTELRDMLLGLKQSVDITIVIVTHDLTDAFLLGQKIVMIEDGRILQTGSREDVFYRPATVRAAELVATRNILQGKVIGQEGSLAVVLWNHQTLKVAVDKHLATNTPVHLCIRPTQIMIRRPETEDGAGQHNVFQGAIVDEVISMETYRLFVSLGPADLRYDLEIDLPGYVYFRLGLDTRKEIEFSIRPEAVHLIPSGN
ncbi:MAG TPA: hypothetical protein VNL15_00485, partial [Dehalococcoidia bacterium]|nr:hypothetical protein [Dehalococcoidia bacterium]